MPSRNRFTPLWVMILALGPAALAQKKSDLPNTATRPTHSESAARHTGAAPPPETEPALPEGMTLDEVLDYASSSPPAHFPPPIPDEMLFAFTLIEQLEYRAANDDSGDPLGWEAQGWIGRDFNKFWWKTEGEAFFDGPDEGETETDLLYARLVSPFWNLQLGAQYANEWDGGEYDGRWSGVVALQGLAPYKFELDNSLYISEDGDVTFVVEAEYNVRVTQRLVLQPRVEAGFAFQDVPERDLGTGFTDVNLDLRLRYEIKRELAPYIGVRYRTLLGETEDIADAAGEDGEQLYFLAGLRFAF